MDSPSNSGPSNSSDRVFPVLLSNRARVEAALAALTKRAVKKGLPALTWSWGKAYSTREHRSESVCLDAGCDGCVNVDRVPLTLVGETPKYAGWSFLAALEHFDGENIVRAVPGHDVPATYRTRGPVCDHCHAARRRNETYVLRHEDGRVLQVGSTCLGDFLGSDTAGKLALAASYQAAARGLAEEGCEGFGNGSGDVTLESFLTVVAWCVRVDGWTSRTAARQSGGSATADRAMMFLSDKKLAKEAGCEPTGDDNAAALSAEAWAEGLSDEEVSRETGDYLHNLRVIARSGVVGHKAAGLAGSMIVAHQRAVGKARARAERAARPVSEYVGEIGKRQSFGEVTLDFVTGFETAYGYTTVLKFLSPKGETITWKASSTELDRSCAGKRYMLTGTVKKHEEYKGQKQTIVSRCKLEEIVEAVEPPAAKVA